MVFLPTNKRFIRPNDKPSFEHSQRYGLIKGHPLGEQVDIWLFNEGSGVKVFDSSGNGNTGTLNADTHFVSGKFGPALAFDGTGDYVDCGNINVWTDGGSITVNAWVYASDYVQNAFIVVKNPVNAQWQLMFSTDGNLKWRGGGLGKDVFSPCPSNNLWHCIAATQTGTAVCLYVDGIMVNSGVGVAIASGAGHVNLGRFDSGYYFTGIIDMPMIYDRALTESEIALLYKETCCMFERGENQPIYVPAVSAPKATRQARVGFKPITGADRLRGIRRNAPY